MSIWSDVAGAANDSIFAAGGETIYYSRPQSLSASAVDEFETQGIPDTSIASIGTDARQIVIQVRLSEISGGPRKDDQVRWNSRTWFVQEILSQSTVDDTANLGLRLAPK
jgi:hypothetical protein